MIIRYSIVLIGNFSATMTHVSMIKIPNAKLNPLNILTGTNMFNLWGGRYL